METIEKEIQVLKKQLSDLEGVKIDVTGLRLTLDKVVRLLEESPSGERESITSIIRDSETVKHNALDKIIYETVSASRKIEKGLVVLSSVKFIQNQAVPIHTQILEFNSDKIIEPDDNSLKRISKYLSALSNPERIKILTSLSERDRSSKEIQKITGKKGGSLYHHLKELTEQNLIRKIGNNYGLTENGKEIMIILGLINQQAIFLEKSMENLEK
ncbi:MAG: ArsR/SmtB family transcription factor [Candidatus Odinarchaeia archaeon]